MTVTSMASGKCRFDEIFFLMLKMEFAKNRGFRFPTTLSEARALLILLKQQIAELDKLQPRSRRSGRC